VRRKNCPEISYFSGKFPLYFSGKFPVFFHN